MVKAPVNKKQKKLKQKQKQSVNVKQNVKVIVGDIKRKRAVKKSGSKTGGNAKPPIILNISNPQPNNVFMEYFKKQLQNQQPIQAKTLNQHEILNEREETKASKAGALHRLDEEPNDLVRRLSKLKVEQVERIRQADAERKGQEQEMQRSIRRIPKPTQSAIRPQPIQATPRYVVEQEQPSEQQASMIDALEQQQTQNEEAMASKDENENNTESSSSGQVIFSGGPPVRMRIQKRNDENEPVTPVRQYVEPRKQISEKPISARRRGRKPLTQEQIDARLKEEERLRRERVGMAAEDPKPRRGRKMLSQEEIDKRRRQKQLDRTFQKIFQERETEEDY